MTYLKDWSPRDRGLAEGLLVYEDGRGPHGVPWRDAFDDDLDGWFEVETRVDHAQAAIEKWRANDGKAAEPGTRVFVVDTRGRDG